MVWRIPTNARYGYWRVRRPEIARQTQTTHEKINGHRELTVSSRWPRWSRLRGPMITAQSRLGEVTAQSRRGHSSVTARSQLSHSEVTAQSRHLQYDHGSVTARSQLNHGPGHDSVTAGCDHFGHREHTVSSPWAHGELIVSSHGGQYFSHGHPQLPDLMLYQQRSWRISLNSSHQQSLPCFANQCN